MSRHESAVRDRRVDYAVRESRRAIRRAERRLRIARSYLAASDGMRRP